MTDYEMLDENDDRYVIRRHNDESGRSWFVPDGRRTDNRWITDNRETADKRAAKLQKTAPPFVRYEVITLR